MLPIDEARSGFIVREILYSRCRGGHLEYLVDWEGYDPEEQFPEMILNPELLSLLPQNSFQSDQLHAAEDDHPDIGWSEL